MRHDGDVTAISMKRGEDREQDYDDWAGFGKSPQKRFVSVKTTGQQDIQALHRLREGRLADRTALCNQLRGLLAEYGLISPKGINGQASDNP